MKNIVVVGATSMLGSELIKLAVKNKCNVLAITRKNSKKLSWIPKSDFVKVQYDFSDPKKNYDILYNFAWAGSNKCERGSQQVQAKNLDYTKKCIEFCKQINCKTYVGVGSQAEYGTKHELITEGTPLNPTSEYGKFKLKACLLSRDLCARYNIKHIWIRVFSIYGIKDHEQSLISKAIDCFNNNRTLNVYSGHVYWNYLHMCDSARMFYEIGNQNIDSGIYNMAHKKSEKIGTYIGYIANCYKNDVKYTLQNNEGVELKVDSKKLRDMINYEYEYDFECEIKEIVHKKNEKN